LIEDKQKHDLNKKQLKRRRVKTEASIIVYFTTTQNVKILNKKHISKYTTAFSKYTIKDSKHPSNFKVYHKKSEASQPKNFHSGTQINNLMKYEKII
jgi:hypothetical protein